LNRILRLFKTFWPLLRRVELLGAPRSFTVLAIVDALMLIGATACAGLFAYKRKIALVFIAGRFVLGVTG
jgi:hypothetical protein